MENIFEKYYIFRGIKYNRNSFELADEAFELFNDLHADKDWMIVKKVKTRNKNKRL